MSFQLDYRLPSPLQILSHPLFTEKQVSVYIKRDDLIHPMISGNKWRKLKAAIESLDANNLRGIASFGGAYSNHLHALAYAGKTLDFKTLGWVRTHALDPNNATLNDCKRWGMQLQPVSRSQYRQQQEPENLKRLKESFKDYRILPEGGADASNFIGIQELVREVKEHFDFWLLPVGSGATLSALVAALDYPAQILGISVLRGMNWRQCIDKQLEQIQQCYAHKKAFACQYAILENYHFGGYAKWSRELLDFIEDFSKSYHIPCEPIYSGKALFALMDLAFNNAFPPHSKILFLHTGGLQGLRGIKQTQTA
ncbi:MAG: pyridoxal-phosphate dependent enzyme [Pseudomonadota bacterium]